ECRRRAVVHAARDVEILAPVVHEDVATGAARRLAHEGRFVALFGEACKLRRIAEIWDVLDSPAVGSGEGKRRAEVGICDLSRGRESDEVSEWRVACRLKHASRAR